MKYKFVYTAGFKTSKLHCLELQLSKEGVVRYAQSISHHASCQLQLVHTATSATDFGLGRVCLASNLRRQSFGTRRVDPAELQMSVKLHTDARCRSIMMPVTKLGDVINDLEASCVLSAEKG